MSVDALTIENLHKTYQNGKVALKGVSLSIQEGDFFAMLGPNGAGKSTTIGIISSLVNKTAGKVAVFGRDIDHDWSGAKQLLGVVPQEFNFNIFEPVIDIIANQAGYYGVPRKQALERAAYYLSEVSLYEQRNNSAQRLSGGMKRRLMIARALVHQPKVLILDEPTAGVDVEIRHNMWEFLRKINQQGTTIILTTHYLEEAEMLCKNIAIIDGGLIKIQSDMRSLLEKINVQTFIFDLQNTFSVPPNADFEMNLLDDLTLEVELSQSDSINELFQYFSANNIAVKSMRNKANRLEEMFIRLTREQSS